MAARHIDVSNLDLFALTDDGRIRWISEHEGAALGPRDRRKLARLPVAGEIAGGKIVHGRGRLVSCRGHRIISGDIASAIRRDWIGHDWPWQAGKPPAVMPLEMSDTVAAEIARAAWCIRPDGAVAWARSPHPDHPAGSVVTGAKTAGDRTIISTKSIGFLVDDVKHLFLNNKWPWEADLWD